MDVRKAYGVLAAVGTKLGERARTEETDLLAEVRRTPDVEAFRAVVRERTRGLLPEALVESFLSEVVQPDDWVLWRSRLLIQMRMTKEGRRPATGHEAGKGVGRP